MKRLGTMCSLCCVGSAISAVLYSCVNYWGSPGPNVCAAIQEFAHEAPASCNSGPQWPIWLCVGLSLAFFIAAASIRTAYGPQPRQDGD